MATTCPGSLKSLSQEAGSSSKALQPGGLVPPTTGPQLVTVDRKAATSDRRKVQMKWCEEQRFKLQRECDDLISARNSVDKLLAKLEKESAWATSTKDSILKQMTPGECDNPIPPGKSLLDYIHIFNTEDT